MQETLKILMDERNSRILGLSSAISAYGIAAIRGAFILNGSAAVAVMTKQGVLTPEKESLILVCAIGAALAVLSAGFSFLSQWWLKEAFLEYTGQAIYSLQHTGVASPFMKSPEASRARCAFYGAAMLYCLSVSFFIFSAIKFIQLS